MYRKIINFLEKWKSDTHRKPLILQGARQVGKTYAVLEFGHAHYENVAYFNFETNPRLKETFAENISPDYHIIVAGSLLGVAVNRETFSFLVGKVDMKTLYPMDMEEFLLACGEAELVEQIKRCFADNTKAKSLKVYMETYKPAYAIKLSTQNFGFKDGKKQFRCMRRSVFDSLKIRRQGFLLWRFFIDGGVKYAYYYRRNPEENGTEGRTTWKQKRYCVTGIPTPTATIR